MARTQNVEPVSSAQRGAYVIGEFPAGAYGHVPEDSWRQVKYQEAPTPALPWGSSNLDGRPSEYDKLYGDSSTEHTLGYLATQVFGVGILGSSQESEARSIEAASIVLNSWDDLFGHNQDAPTLDRQEPNRRQVVEWSVKETLVNLAGAYAAVSAIPGKQVVGYYLNELDQHSNSNPDDKSVFAVAGLQFNSSSRTVSSDLADKNSKIVPDGETDSGVVAAGLASADVAVRIALYDAFVGVNQVLDVIDSSIQLVVGAQRRVKGIEGSAGEHDNHRPIGASGVSGAENQELANAKSELENLQNDPNLKPLLTRHGRMDALFSALKANVPNTEELKTAAQKLQREYEAESAALLARQEEIRTAAKPQGGWWHRIPGSRFLITDQHVAKERGGEWVSTTEQTKAYSRPRLVLAGSALALSVYSGALWGIVKAPFSWVFGSDSTEEIDVGPVPDGEIPDITTIPIDRDETNKGYLPGMEE